MASKNFEISEEKYRLITENTNDLIRVLDDKFIIQYINGKTHSRILGYSKEELLGKSAYALIHPDEKKAVRKFIREISKKGDSKREGRLKHKDGYWMWFDIHGKFFEDSEGKWNGLIISRDISEKKDYELKLKQSEEKYRRITENANDLIGILNRNFIFEFANEQATFNTLGYKSSEVVGKSVVEFLHPLDKDKGLKSLLTGLSKKQGIEEIRVKHKNGEYVWLEVKGKVFVDKNGKNKGILVARDINARKAIEEGFKVSEEKYRHLYNTTPFAILLFDIKGNILECNDATSVITGYLKEELIGKNFKNFSFYVDPKTVNLDDRQSQVSSGKTPEARELLFYRKDGSQFWGNSQIEFIKFGEDTYIQAIIRDITERKKAEQKLKESEEKFREIAEQSFMAISVLQDGVFKYVNARMAEVNGYSIDEIKNWKFNEFAKIIHPEDREFVMKQARRKQAGDPDVINQYPFRIIKKDGEIRWLEIYSKTINYEGNPANLTMSIDITDKVIAEHGLKESEEKYRSLFNNMNAGFAYHELIVDEENKPIDYKYIEANPAFEKLTGLKIRDIIGKNVTEILPGTENDPADWIGKFGSIGLTGIPLTIEDYSEAINRWYKVSGYSPKKGYFAVTFTDITERKMAEQKLKESEKKFRTIFEANPDLYFLVSEDTTILDYRGKEQELYVAPEEILRKKVVDIMPHHLGTQTIEKVKKTILTKEPQILEYELELRDKIHFYEARYFYFSENQVSIFVRDITERKNAEKQIMDIAKFPSENPNPVLRVTKEKVIYINKSGQNLLDLTESSKIPSFFKDEIIKAFNENIVIAIEVKFDGQIYSFNIVPILKEGYANIYGQDITERLKSEKALNTEKMFTEDILNSSGDTIFVFDPKAGKAHRWNKGFKQVSGYTDEEIFSLKAPDSYYSDEDLIRASTAIQNISKEGKTTVEMMLITKDSKKIPYEYTGTSFKSSDGKNLIVSVGRDMTERIEAENKLKESEKKFQEAFERASFFKDLFAHDINNILQVITSSAELISYQLDDSEKFKDIDNIASIIRKHVQKGAKLVRNVRTLSELDDSDSLLEPIEGMSVLKNSIKFIKSAYSERYVKVKVDTFANMFSVYANELLQEIFDNILINAIKYNENTPVDIQIKITKKKRENENYIKMEFLDNGIGVQDNKKKVLFKEGYGHLKVSKGMGVGLSLVRKILTSYNGQILVEDKVKGDHTKGSNFILLLPVSD